MATTTDNDGGREGDSGDRQPALSAMIYPILQLKELDTNLYQGADLWRPRGARGVFGGQVVGQALVAGTAGAGMVALCGALTCALWWHSHENCGRRQECALPAQV